MTARRSSAKVVVISGPTGSGKSAVAMSLVRRTDLPEMEIISADSRQVYREMDIGTDKPGRAARKAVPHHLLDVVLPPERYSAADFERDAAALIETLGKTGKLPLVVGGTGLYIRALLNGLAPVGGEAFETRETLRRELAEKGVAVLYQRLLKQDPDRARKIQPNDAFRIIRALEILEQGVHSITGVYGAHAFREQKYKNLFFILSVERSELYKRIESRVDQMVERGLFQEVRQLVEKYGEGAPGLSGIGYRQVLQFLNHRMTKEQVVERIKRDTRRYAKRQITWFKKEKGAIWITHDPLNPEKTVARIAGEIRVFVND